MHFAAELLLAAGASVVLDGPYQHPEDWEDLARVGPYRLIECRVSPETAAARLLARGWHDPNRPDLTAEKVMRLARQYPYQGTGLLLDTDATSAAQCLAEIETVLVSD